VSASSFNDEILIGSGEFTEDFNLVSKNNIGLNSTFSRYYGGSGNHSGNCILKGNVNISGAATTRFRMSGIQIGTGGIGGQLNITDTAGRMYFRNSFYSGTVTFSGSSSNWFEFHECGFAQVPVLFDSGTPNSNVVIRFYNCTFPTTGVLICTQNITVQFYNCQNIPSLNFTNGNVIVNDTLGIGLNASNSVLFNNPAGICILNNTSVLQSDLSTYGIINITAAAAWDISNVQRLESQDTLPATNRLTPSTQAYDTSYIPAADSIYGSSTNVKEALDALNTLNPYANSVGWVSAAAAPNGNGSFDKPFDTIQAALNSAGSGGAAVYMVAVGNYTENLTFPDGVITKLVALGS
jgi:hypothetical protein